MSSDGEQTDRTSTADLEQMATTEAVQNWVDNLSSSEAVTAPTAETVESPFSDNEDGGVIGIECTARLETRDDAADSVTLQAQQVDASAAPAPADDNGEQPESQHGTDIECRTPANDQQATKEADFHPDKLDTAESNPAEGRIQDVDDELVTASFIDSTDPYDPPEEKSIVQDNQDDEPINLEGQHVSTPPEAGQKEREGSAQEEREEEDCQHADITLDPRASCTVILEMADKEKEGSLNQTSDDMSNVERGGWGNKLDFLFSCISVSVGLGNIWRFPYLCFKNGGGTFLVTYMIAMIFCGIPVFYQEVAIGQYLGVGGMTLIGELAPIMKGVGYATMTVVFLIDTYYSIIIAWTLFYLIASFTALPGLPWQDCGNSWNTDRCFVTSANVTNFTHVANSSIVVLANETVSPVEEFWNHRVLGITDGLENVGSMRWELLGVLVLSWVLVYFIIWKGINQSGYIIWFTALFPYVILTVLLVRAVTLEGAALGLLYYVTPKWDLLLTSGPWIDGATQIFFGYSIGSGALPVLGSYNNFKHNCYRDAVITCIVNTLTCLMAGVVTFSILGNIAVSTNSDIESVVSSGPGLVFITYPQVVLQLPGAPIWAILFFIMLTILGIDSEFCMIESFVTGVVDNWPNKLRKHRKLFTFGVALTMFVLSLPMLTEGGVYIFQILDYYSASGMSMLFLVFFQTISISWIFGGQKFCDCIEQMVGHQPSRFLYICWVFLAPAVMLSIFVFYVVQYQPVKYGNDYQYPDWAQFLGVCISVSSMMWIPLYALYYIIVTPGTFTQALTKGLTPVFTLRYNPEDDIKKDGSNEMGLKPFNADLGTSVTSLPGQWNESMLTICVSLDSINDGVEVK